MIFLCPIILPAKPPYKEGLIVKLCINLGFILLYKKISSHIDFISKKGLVDPLTKFQS